MVMIVFKLMFKSAIFHRKYRLGCMKKLEMLNNF